MELYQKHLDDCEGNFLSFFMHTIAVKRELNKMRLLIIFILIFSRLYAQQDYVKEINAIAASEQLNHSRIINSSAYNATTASNNFDVKYYRCQWQVDPAVRYIQGQITVYYVITTATNSISFDLMNALTADSVKQRNTVLEKLHSNNILQINFPQHRMHAFPKGTYHKYFTKIAHTIEMLFRIQKL